jgi:hypothetical protein
MTQARPERDPKPSRRKWKPADDAASASPEARRFRLLRAAADGTPLDPAEAAGLLGNGWSAARVARLRPGTRVSSGSQRAGSFRVWRLPDGRVRLSGVDGLRSPGNPSGRPPQVVADQH